MNLYFRLALAWLRSLRTERLTPMMSTNTHFRVLPSDLDVFGHMNNGRFLQIMDVARFEWMLRTNVWSALRREGWLPSLGGNLVHYRRALKPFARYRVQTQLLGYEGPWVLLEHRFRDANGRIAAVSCTRASLRRGRRMVPGQEVFETVDPRALDLRPPAYVIPWLEADRMLYDRSTSLGERKEARRVEALTSGRKPRHHLRLSLEQSSTSTLVRGANS